MKTIGLLGSGRIALEYAKVIKNLGYKIDFASSSSQNSKSWKKTSQNYRSPNRI